MRAIAGDKFVRLTRIAGVMRLTRRER